MNTAFFRENRVATLFGVLVLTVLPLAFLPPIAQDPAYHNFADQRPFFGIVNFGDVVSNLAFVIAGVAGLWHVTGARGAALFEYPSDGLPWRIFFAGVCLIGLGSGYYHVEPTTETLVWDRLPMTIAFMSSLAAFVTDRINRRAGLALVLPGAISVGILSIVWWAWSENLGQGDLRPYILVQFGLFIFLPVICWLWPETRYSRAKYLAPILGVYALSKIAEYFDAGILDLTLGLMSGHTLKHLFAAVACYLPVAMLHKSTESWSNFTPE